MHARLYFVGWTGAVNANTETVANGGQCFARLLHRAALKPTTGKWHVAFQTSVTSEPSRLAPSGLRPANCVLCDFCFLNFKMDTLVRQEARLFGTLQRFSSFSHIYLFVYLRNWSGQIVLSCCSFRNMLMFSLHRHCLTVRIVLLLQRCCKNYYGSSAEIALLLLLFLNKL